MNRFDSPNHHYHRLRYGHQIINMTFAVSMPGPSSATSVAERGIAAGGSTSNLHSGESSLLSYRKSSAKLSASPIRSSPLSNPPIGTYSRHVSASAIPKPIPSSQRRLSIRSQPLGGPSTPSRPIATGQSMTPSPPLSRSHPLLGSYPLSLLHSRMSHAHKPHSVSPTPNNGFSIHLGALGKGKSCPPELRCPCHEILPLAATYYDLEDGGRKSQTPWVGTVDLEEHYYEKYGADNADDGVSKGPSTPPEYPGYRVAPVGQLQILVRTPTSAVKVFLVPYDLRCLEPGGRLLARERTYVQASPSTAASTSTPGPSSPSSLKLAGGAKEKLRYSFQLQFICLPKQRAAVPARESSTTRRPRQRDVHPSTGEPDTSAKRMKPSATVGMSNDYYVSRQIKVIFTSTPPEKEEEVRTERTDETVLPSTEASLDIARGRTPSSSFTSTSFLGPSSPMGQREDWEVVRRKWFARREVEAASLASLLDLTPADQLRPSTPPVSLLSSQVLSPPSTRTRPSSPSRTESPLPMLAPLALLPLKSGRLSPSPQSPSIKTPPPFRYPSRQRLRRGSGSLDERELSERLRGMDMQEASGKE